MNEHNSLKACAEPAMATTVRLLLLRKRSKHPPRVCVGLVPRGTVVIHSWPGRLGSLLKGDAVFGLSRVFKKAPQVTQRCRSIAIVNQKGGVGKTTTTVNLAASLAILGSRVLIVDLDPQGNTTSGFGIDKAGLEQDVYSVLLADVPAREAIVGTNVPRLDLLPATLGLAAAEIELVSATERETRLQVALATIDDAYDYVLIDCPPSLGLLTLNALTAAGEVLIPVQAEYYALEGLSQLTRVVERVRDAFNSKLHISGVLVTMFDGRTRLAMEVLEEVNGHFPRQVFRTQIPRNVRLSEAPSYGKPVALFDPKSRGALAYFALAREVAKV